MTTYDQPVDATLQEQLANGKAREATDEDLKRFGYAKEKNMSSQRVRIIIPAHRFVEADRGTDSADGKEGLCVYRIDGSSGEFCDNSYVHNVHHGIDEPRYESEWA
jgi:hypothetical protein